MEVIFSLLVIPASLWLGVSATQRAILIGSYLLIPMTEVLNSAIETVVDRIGQERHPLSKKAKDIGSAAVFCAICITSISWIIIACERFL